MLNLLKGEVSYILKREACRLLTSWGGGGGMHWDREEVEIKGCVVLSELVLEKFGLLLSRGSVGKRIVHLVFAQK